jgi:hypothetical protein
MKPTPIVLFIVLSCGAALTGAEGRPANKKCAVAAQQKVQGPSQAELAKRQREIEQIEEAKRKKERIETVDRMVSPVTPPAGRVVSGTDGSSMARKTKPSDPKAPDQDC